jgi:hypothetical protein
MAYAIRFSRVVLLLILAVGLAAGALIFANGSSSDNVLLRDLAGSALTLADARVGPVGSEHPAFTQWTAVDLVRERYPGVDIYKTSLISFTALSTHDARLAWAVLIDPASADKLIACDNPRVCPSPGPGYVTVVDDAQTGQVLVVAGAVAA